LYYLKKYTSLLNVSQILKQSLPLDGSAIGDEAIPTRLSARPWTQHRPAISLPLIREIVRKFYNLKKCNINKKNQNILKNPSEHSRYGWTNRSYSEQ
jgi:hypothetical protein